MSVKTTNFHLIACLLKGQSYTSAVGNNNSSALQGQSLSSKGHAAQQKQLQAAGFQNSLPRTALETAFHAWVNTSGQQQYQPPSHEKHPTQGTNQCGVGE